MRQSRAFRRHATTVRSPHANGDAIDVRAVERGLATEAISVRTGCFCNPGAAEAAFALTKADIARARRSNSQASEDYAAEAGIPGGGAIRASVGLASNFADVDRLLAAIATTYRDQDRIIADSMPLGDPQKRSQLAIAQDAYSI